jgi:transcription elongation factor Elf1
MDLRVVNRRIRCPFCDESMTIVIDLSAGGQSYIEDCQVCCQPMGVVVDVGADGQQSVRVERAS